MTIMDNQPDCEINLEKNDKSDKDKEFEKQIVETIAKEKDAFFKFQSLNAEDLSTEEKKNIIEQLLHSNKSQFMQRYGKFLNANQLEYFQNDPSEDVRIQVKCLQDDIQSSRFKLLRNRRYQALQDLLKNSSYFSDSEMQSRDPFLFEQMVGRYMTENEKRDLQSSSYANNYDRIAFSSFLFERIRHAQMEMETSIMEQKFQEEEEESEDDDQIETNDNLKEKISDHEKQLLRDEFRDIMIQNFLNGKDTEHFDYGKVDNNTDFDLSKEYERDQEDKYFDSDD